MLVTAGLWYLPGIVQRMVVWRLQAAHRAHGHDQALDISLTSGEFSIRGFRVADREPGLPLAAVRGSSRALPPSLAAPRVTSGSRAWRSPAATRGSSGWDPTATASPDLLPQGPSSAGTIDVSIDHFTITGGWVELEDRVLARAHLAL